MEVNENMRSRTKADSRPEIGTAIRAVRKRLGLTQAALAEALGARQTSLSRWEKGTDRPPHTALLLLADLVPDDEKVKWQVWAGIKAVPLEPQAPRQIPVLHDAAAAGTPRMVEETEVEYYLSLPSHLLPIGGKLFGVPVQGDSMSPILETGYVAIVNVMRRDPKELVNHMVAARDADGGVTLKWLRFQEPMYILVPQNTSLRHPVVIIRENDQFSIIGEVVKFIGEPTLPRK